MRLLLCLALIGCASVGASEEDDPMARDPDGGAAGALGCVRDPAGPRYQLASNSLKLPTSATGYLLDIDGDTRPDNQLKAVVALIAGAGFDLQGPIDKSVQIGEVVILLDLHTADLTSGCAGLTLSLAQRPMAPPRYDGTDRFSPSGAQQPAVLYGSTTNGKMSTILPKDERGAEVQQIQLSVHLTMGTLPLTIYGVHVQGALSPSGVMSGELHGVIRRTDIDGQIIPALAQMVTDQIRKAPMSGTADSLVRIFEDQAGNDASKRKCADTPQKCCATPANRATTCEITAEEVRTNGLLASALTADVQAYQDGVWKPLANGPMKDAMSVGLGFTAVKAQF